LEYFFDEAIRGQSFPMQDEPESKSHAANILSNNLSLSNCTFLAVCVNLLGVVFFGEKISPGFG